MSLRLVVTVKLRLSSDPLRGLIIKCTNEAYLGADHICAYFHNCISIELIFLVVLCFAYSALKHFILEGSTSFAGLLRGSKAQKTSGPWNTVISKTVCSLTF